MLFFSLISSIFLFQAIDCYIYNEDGNIDSEAIAREFTRRMNSWKRKEDKVKERLREAGFTQFEAIFDEEDVGEDAGVENQVLILTGNFIHFIVKNSVKA